MAIFATDNKFNILDDPNADFLGKTPKKPKIWGYLFWIGLFLLAFLILWNISTTHAQVIGYYQQQDTSTSSPQFTDYGRFAWGQSNFTLNNPASSTLSSIKLHLKYGDSGDTGKTHKICVSQQVAIDSSWYLASPLGCFSRAITSSDFTTDKDYNFTGSSISLAPNLYYAFFNAGNATNTADFMSIYYGILDIDLRFYGNSNEFAYGADNLAASASFSTSLPSALMSKYAPDSPNYGVADLFFIAPASFQSGGSVPPPTSCEGGGVFDTLLCNLYVSLFVPSDNALNQFSGLWDNIKSKPPFGYFVAINTAMSGIAVGTSTLQFAGISDISFFGTLRTALVVLLWFLFVFWIFHRLRNFNF